MSHGKTRIILSRAWAVAVCSVGVALVALLGACRSKKAVATDREDVKVDTQERIREMQIKLMNFMRNPKMESIRKVNLRI